MKEIIIELKADLKERGIEAYSKAKPGAADHSPVDKTNGRRPPVTMKRSYTMYSVNPSENDQHDLPYLKIACKDVETGSSSSTLI